MYNIFHLNYFFFLLVLQQFYFVLVQLLKKIFPNPYSTFTVMNAEWLECWDLHLSSLQPETCSLLWKNVSSCLSHLSNWEIIYRVYILNSNSCLRALHLAHEHQHWRQRGLFLMYISFRFNRSSVQHKYNLKGSLIWDNMNIQPLWELHQSVINANTYLSLGVSPSTTFLFIVNFLEFILPWVCVTPQQEGGCIEWALIGQNKPGWVQLIRP